MPASLVKSFAKRQGVSVSRAEHLWDKAKKLVQDEYDLSEPDENTPKKQRQKYYRLVTGILKKMLRIKTEADLYEALKEGVPPALLLAAYTRTEPTCEAFTEPLDERSGDKVAKHWSEIDREISKLVGEVTRLTGYSQKAKINRLTELQREMRDAIAPFKMLV
jgi:hypothetical protein